MNRPDASSAGLKVSMVSILSLFSKLPCDSCQAWIFAVQVTSVVPSQNPIVSPYHCGVFCTCCLPIITCRRKLSAMPDRNWMFHVLIVSWKFPACEGCAHQRVNPSGQQNEALHCGALVTDSW